MVLNNYEKTSKLIKKRLLPKHVLWYYVNNYNLVLVCLFLWRNKQAAPQSWWARARCKKVRDNLKDEAKTGQHRVK